MTSRHRFCLALLAVPLLATLPSCRKEETPKAPAGFRVALLTPGPVSDAGWNAGAYEGLKAGNPGAKATTVFTGSFEDVAGAKAAALALVDQGNDFLFHNANAAALGVFNAATERGVWAFGSNRDQNSLAPSSCASSGSAVTTRTPAPERAASRRRALTSSDDAMSRPRVG